MKQKIPLIIGILILNMQFIFAQEILTQNSEHVIYYEIKGDNIVFTVEDLKDNENNIKSAGGKDGRNWYCGKKPDVYTRSKSSYYFRYGQLLNGQYDQCFVEIDVYQNNNFKNYFANGKWTTSKNKTSRHPVWTFEKPLEDLLKTDDFKIKVRFFISRVAENQKDNIKYKTYYYPYQKCECDGGRNHVSTSNKSYTINLNGKNLPVIEKIKSQQAKDAEKDELVNLMSEVYNNLVTYELNNNATITNPEFAGVYTQLSDGRIIEIPDQSFTYGASYCKAGYKPTRPASYCRSNRVPFYTEKEFKQLGILKVKKSDFVNFKINSSGGELKKSLSYLTLHPIKKIELTPVTSCRIYVWPDDDKGDVTELTNETVFYFDKEVSISDNFEGNSIYRYETNSSLKPGLYGFWLNNIAWIIEITN